jgi:hypothetical protein
VFAIDEKPQVQALNRSAPTLPMLPTTPARATHDYIRNGTLDLFAALNVATRRSPTASPGCVRHGKRRASREHRRGGPDGARAAVTHNLGERATSSRTLPPPLTAAAAGRGWRSTGLRSRSVCTCCVATA